MTGILAALMPAASQSTGDYINIANASVTDSINGGTASASYRITNGGKYQLIASHGSTVTNDAVIPNGNIGNYEAFVTVTSGTLTSGTTGSWVALSATQTWTKTATNTFATCAFTLQLRIAATGVVVKTITVSLEADGSP